MADIDDVEGHKRPTLEDTDSDGQIYKIPAVDEDDVAGHKRPALDEDDDVEGHKRAVGIADDDTEGHILRLPNVSDDDDVEGHTRRPMGISEPDHEGSAVGFRAKQ